MKKILLALLILGILSALGVSAKQCSEDYDCGIQSKCDYAEKAIYKPYCSNGYCDSIVTKVECCIKENCPTGYFCDTTEYKCRKEWDVISPCPGQCCQGDSRYVDRPCPPEKPYCDPIGMSCYSSPHTYTQETSSDTGTIVIVLVIVAVIVAGIIWAVSRKKSEKSRKGDFCKKCGVKISLDSEYCQNCGIKQ